MTSQVDEPQPGGPAEPSAGSSGVSDPVSQYDADVVVLADGDVDDVTGADEMADPDELAGPHDIAGLDDMAGPDDMARPDDMADPDHMADPAEVAGPDDMADRGTAGLDGAFRDPVSNGAVQSGAVQIEPAGHEPAGHEPAGHEPLGNGGVSDQWHDIQAMFVDDPQGSVQRAAAAADAAVSALVDSLRERQAALVPAGGPSDPSGTEQLRETLRGYRIFCQRLAELDGQLPRTDSMAS